MYASAPYSFLFLSFTDIFSSSADALVVSVHAVRFDAEMQAWQLDASNASHPPGLALLWASAAQEKEGTSNVSSRLYYTVRKGRMNIATVLMLAAQDHQAFPFQCKKMAFVTVPTRVSPHFCQDLEDGVVASEWELLRRLALEGPQAVSTDLGEFRTFLCCEKCGIFVFFCL